MRKVTLDILTEEHLYPGSAPRLKDEYLIFLHRKEDDDLYFPYQDEQEVKLKSDYPVMLHRTCYCFTCYIPSLLITQKNKHQTYMR